MNNKVYMKFTEKAEQDCEKCWDAYEKLTRQERQARIHEMYVIEELLSIIQSEVMTNELAMVILSGKENMMRYLYGVFEERTGLSLCTQEVYDFIQQIEIENGGPL